jgi:hypothetical protein
MIIWHAALASCNLHYSSEEMNSLNLAACFLLSFNMQMDELACFAPGMLALGSSGYGPDESQKIFTLAEEVFVTSFKSRLETIACLVG